MLSLIILIPLALTMACTRRVPPASEPAERRYELKGRVESIDLANQRVTIAHEDIKGYMEAMTMGFAVKDEKVLRELKSGDRVTATLVFDTSTNLSRLEDLKVTAR
jgi:protein SCO1/2